MTKLPPPLQALAAPSTELGLRAGQARIVDHNPAWSALYETVAEHLRDALGELDAQVEHIGSTSVPGLAAKPVLDIAIGAIPPIDDQRYIDAVGRAGFTFEADLGIYGGLFFTAAAEPDVVLAHVHVVDAEDFQWRWYRTLRDGLRSDPELRATYGELKRNAAAANPDDRDRYNQAKFDWVLATVSELDAN